MSIISSKDKPFTINGTSNAQECGLFNTLYAVAGPKSNLEFSTLLVDDNGNFVLYDFMPNIRENEVYNFLNKPLRIFRNELTNGVITTSLRGMTDSDFVHLPYSAPVDLRRVINEGQMVNCFLVDTATDEIKGIRMVELSDKTISQLLDDWIAVEDRELGPVEIEQTLNDSVYCYTSKDYQKRCTYVGRNVSSITTKHLYTSIL